MSLENQPASGQQPAAAAPAAAAPAEHPATVSAPWSGSTDVYKIGEGDKATEWWNGIPEEPVRELMKTKAYKNPSEVAMAYHNLNKLQNNAPDVLAAPKWDDADSVNKFFTKLGRPETPDSYDLKVPEGVQIDENFMKIGKEIFHDLGANPALAQKALDKWEGFVATQKAAEVAKEQQINTEELTALEKKWGDSATLEANRAAGQRAVKALGLDTAVIDKIESKVGSAAIIELLAAIGKKSGEGNGNVGSGNGGGDPNDPNNMTKEQAKSRITELEGDTAFMAKYRDKNAAGHAEALSLMERLYAKS